MGRDTTLTVVANGEKQDSITDVKDFEIELQCVTKSEGYLGERTNRKDETYDGVRGKITLHFHNADIFRLLQAITDRAKRRTPGVRINISSTLQFDNGDRPVLTVSDVYFSSIPVNFSGRTEYGVISLSWEAADYQLIMT
jgi:hypothetical protein